MGLLRYFLAIVVAMGHSPAAFFKPLGGDGGLAVQSFFVISGFYMSLIIDKYSLRSLSFSALKNFYSSRLVRLLPIYYICLLMTLVLVNFNIAPPYYHSPDEVLTSLSSISDKLLYLFSNLFLMGQDVMRFLSYDPTHHSFILDVFGKVSDPMLGGSGFATLGQAWSLSLEVTFYLLVPFLLVRNNKFVLITCILSFLLRLVLSYFGFDTYNAQHAFFPTALGVFLLGSLSYRYIYPLIYNKTRSSLKRNVSAFFGILLVYSAMYHKFNGDLKYWGFVVLICIALPYLFAYFNKSSWDKFIGELSYPVYMTHFFCIHLIAKFAAPQYTAYLVVLLSTAISCLLYFLVVKPIDQYRHAKFILRSPSPVEPESVLATSG